MSATAGTPRRLTVADIARMHADGERIPMLTAYDYPTAPILDEAGIPMLLVGDSRRPRSMLGYETTVRVTMAEMLHHTKAVVRGTQRALVVGDMPFLSYAHGRATPSPTPGASCARAAPRPSRSRAASARARTIEAIVRAGIPVMGHIGWTPQASQRDGRQGPRPGQDPRRGPQRSSPTPSRSRRPAPSPSCSSSCPSSSRPRSPSACAIPTIGIGAGRRLQRPGPGHHRPARAGRVHPPPRPPVRRPARARSAGGRRRGPRTWRRARSPVPSRVGPDGRRRPRRGPRPDAARPSRRQDPCRRAIPLDRDL